MPERESSLANTSYPGFRDGAGVQALDSFYNGADGEFPCPVPSRGAERLAAPADRVSTDRNGLAPTPTRPRAGPRAPVTPSTTMSTMPPEAAATTGLPAAIASSTTVGQAIGPTLDGTIDRARGPEQLNDLIVRQRPEPLNTIRHCPTRRPGARATGKHERRRTLEQAGRPPTASGTPLSEAEVADEQQRGLRSCRWNLVEDDVIGDEIRNDLCVQAGTI